ELVAGIDVVVARIEITVVLKGDGVAAGFAKDAQGRGHAQPDAELDVEDLDEDFADVFFDPLVENGDEKIAVGLGADGPFGDISAEIGNDRQRQASFASLKNRRLGEI